MKSHWSNEHASLKCVVNSELPAHLHKVREITHLETEEKSRKQGFATELLKQVCDAADDHQIALLITPRPYDNKPMKLKELVNWYKKFGFTQIQYDPVLMARQPRINLNMNQVSAAAKESFGG